MNSTHYLSSSSGTSVKIYLTDTYSITTPNNTRVIVEDEGIGTNCAYHSVTINEPLLIETYGKTYKALTGSVYALDGTPDSAPRINVYPSSFIDSYKPPEWTNQIGSPYLNKKDQKYYIGIRTDSKTIPNMDDFKQTSINIGLKLLLDFYYKNNSDQNIDLLTSYYKFAEFADYDIPFAKNLRIKSLIAVPKKYFDAQPQKQYQVDPYATSVTGYYVKDFFQKATKVADLLKQYQKDIDFYNVNIGGIDLKQDAQQLLGFHENLKKYCMKNDISERRFNSPRGRVELAIDDCYRIRNVSHYVQNESPQCINITIGLSELKTVSPFNNTTIVYLISQLDLLSQLRYCDVSWIDFLNTYYYPLQNIPAFENPMDKFENAIDGTVQKILNSGGILDLGKELQSLIEAHLSTIKNAEDINLEDITFAQINLKLLQYQKGLNIFVGLDFIKNVKETFKNVDKNTIIQILKKIKICELSLSALECLSELFTITEIERTKLSFSYNEIKNDIVPALTKDEKRTFFSQLIESNCINKTTIYNLLSKFATDEELAAMSSKTEDELKQTLIDYMVGE